MWDRYYWRTARQSFRDQRRASRQAYRNARRNYRYYRGRSPFWGVLLAILIISSIASHSLFPLIPLVIIGGFVFMLVRSSMFRSNNSWFSGSNRNDQQSNQYYQPPQPNEYYQPPQQPNEYYQPSVPPQPNPPYTQPYGPYEQGYQAPRNEYQQGAQPYQRDPSQSTTEQYEEPQAQYPQEMPPMG